MCVACHEAGRWPKLKGEIMLKLYPTRKQANAAAQQYKLRGYNYLHFAQFTSNISGPTHLTIGVLPEIGPYCYVIFYAELGSPCSKNAVQYEDAKN